MRYRHVYHLLILFYTLTTFSSCTTTKKSVDNGSQEEAMRQTEIFAIKNVNIIPMTTQNNIIENATVVIKDRKILSIDGPIHADATIIDGIGKWLMPGLIDMHVHNLADISFGSNYPTKGATLFTGTQDFMLLYAANGVTTAFELSAGIEHFGQRNEIIMILICPSGQPPGGSIVQRPNRMLRNCIRTVIFIIAC